MAKYMIPQSMIKLLDDKVAKFQKKYKNVETVYTKSEPYIQDNELHAFYGSWVIDVELDAKYQIEGYEFVADLKWNTEIKENIIKSVVDAPDVPDEYLTSCKCDHCAQNKYRTHTILLRNIETGEFKQLGSTCVKDYLGIDVGNYASFLECFKSLDEYVNECCHTGGVREYGITHEKIWNTSDVLSMAVAVVREYGYTSTTTAELEGMASTSDITFAWLLGKHHTLNVEFKDIKVTDEDKKTAEDIRDYIDSIDINDPDLFSRNYIHNLKAVAKSSVIPQSEFNLLVSAVGTYRRHLREVENAKRRDGTRYYGQVGEKITITGTPTLITQRRNEVGYGVYATSYMYKFSFNDGEVIWWTAKDLPEDEITLTGTIKSLGEFNGIRQTTITRCKIKEVA